MATEYILSHTGAEIDEKLNSALLCSFQELTDEQKTQARINIGTVDASNVYLKTEIDSMFGEYVSEVAELIGGDA